MEQYYYPKTIKMVTTALLDVFNGIVIRKFDDSSIYTSAANQPYIQQYNVPLQFGPIEKAQTENLTHHYYDVDNTEHGTRFYMMVPRMALVLNGIAYDPNRAYGVNEWRYWFSEAMELDSNASNVFSDYQPTPYNFYYSLSIRADKLDNLSQILENILPYFNPKLFLRVKEFSFLNIERDLPVAIDAVLPEFVEDMADSDDRYVNANLNLTVEAFMYRPWTRSKVIHVINSRYFVRDTYVTSSAPPTSAYSLAERYSTSGFDTSGGIFPASATAMSGLNTDDLLTSGHYDTSAKDFYWATILSGGTNH